MNEVWMNYTVCLFRKTRLKKQGIHSVNLLGQKGAIKKPIKKKNKGVQKPHNVNGASNSIQKKEPKGVKCHFCKKLGHFQKDFQKWKAWFEKKGKPSAFVCFESNLAEVPSNTWWIDSGCTTHVTNVMQGFLTTQTIKPNEKFVFMGNRVKAPVEAIETYHLILDTGNHLDLFQTLYVLSISRNLVSLSKLDASGYSFEFGNGRFSLFKHNSFIGSGILCDGLYKLKLDNLFSESLLTLHHSIGSVV